MKISEKWLREWINPALTREELCACLTMAGLEIEEIKTIAEPFSHVVVCKVLEVEKHPEADRLQVCKVDMGKPDYLTIVCGAKNVVVGMKAAVALEGAVLSNNLVIKASKLRGVISQGMMCSARELGLADDTEGLLVLPPDAPIGESVWDYLVLGDHIIDVSITPNRGDCLSILGLAHEIQAITKTPAVFPAISAVNANISDVLPITIHEPDACPRYAGRIVRHVKADAITPIWMQERLRRAGIRRISAVVDIMNYVMLELGQPMHAFDFAKITNHIHVRMAKKGEHLLLLDKQAVELNQTTLVIADQEKPLAIAGIMGGFDSGVSILTQDIFLESAFFTSDTIVDTAREYKLTSDSAYRFERGVDPELQVRAIERATQLLLDITGGQPGPVMDIAHATPTPRTIYLRAEKIEKLLGIKILNADIVDILERLGCCCVAENNGWNVTVPVRRFDLNLEVDLIEEVARLYGYNNIPLHDPVAKMQMNSCAKKYALHDLGFQEVITYSFIDKKIQTLFDPDVQPIELVNPISSEMAVMRTNLWPGLVNTLLYNQNRQQPRAKIIETGLRFVAGEQQKVLAGLVSGSVFPEQWGIPAREMDFFDLKGDLEHISDKFIFSEGRHPALHPGQTAAIYLAGQQVGIMGALHPGIIQQLDIQHKTFVFEILLNQLGNAVLPKYTELSKFPEIRRDIAILVDQSISSQMIQIAIAEAGGDLLKEIKLFDVYQGKGIGSGQKSMALGLTLQHAERTLVDKEVADIVERVIVALKDQFAAELRG